MTFYIWNYHNSSLITDSVNPCYIPNALLSPAVCSALDVLLGIVSIHESGHLYLGVENSRQMWLSVPYSKCPTRYSSMFCSRWPTWNSWANLYWANLYGVKKILLRLEHMEFKANVVVCPFTEIKKAVASYCM